jgi:hypothetical protein
VVHPFLQLGEGLPELLLLLGQFLVLRLERVDLLLGGRLAGQRLPGEVLASPPERRLGLVVEVGRGVPQLLLLQLDPLAGGGDVNQAPADPGYLVMACRSCA